MGINYPFIIYEYIILKYYDEFVFFTKKILVTIIFLICIECRPSKKKYKKKSVCRKTMIMSQSASLHAHSHTHHKKCLDKYLMKLYIYDDTIHIFFFHKFVFYILIRFSFIPFCTSPSSNLIS